MKNRFLSLAAMLIATSSQAQTYTKDWHLKYSPKDTVFGINLNQALRETPQPAGAKPVIVAVIDNGIDIKHPDLSSVIWTNTKEIPNNAVDDDHNGYIDDVNGWDFLGNIGKDINQDNLELTRKIRDYRKRFANVDPKTLSKQDKKEYEEFLKLDKKFSAQVTMLGNNYTRFRDWLKQQNTLIGEIGRKVISFDSLEAFVPTSNEAKLAKNQTLALCYNAKTGYKMPPVLLFNQIEEIYKYYNTSFNFHYNVDFDPRPVIGDNYLDVNDNKYGNNEVGGPDPDHGSHVGGIIGAVRNNNIGMDGICPMVQLMSIRVVPDGDERDKDVALAIRYAVDNGAKVINMSFGKAYTFNKAAVDAAVKYAESKDVLIIHAAGNDGKNLESESNFPTPFYLDGSRCSTWIEVGASDIDQHPADFSNYGKTTVNVFAPGVEIYSTTPDSNYAQFSGTSMASPVVAGIAALIRAYYPSLTAVQVKQAIESTVVKPEGKYRKPGTFKGYSKKGKKKAKKTKYSKLCTTAGVVNADAALKAAAAMAAAAPTK